MSTHQSPLNPLVYTCIMSAFSLPNLEAVLTRRPSHVVLVVSNFSKAQEAAQRMTEVLQDHAPDIQIHRLGKEHGEGAFSGNDPLSDQAWVDEHFIPFMERAEFSGRPHWLNLTGGTKSMSLALSTCRHWDGLEYKPEGKNALSHFKLAPHQNGLLQLQSSEKQQASTALKEVAAMDVARLYNPSVETGKPKLKNDDLAAQIFDALHQQDAGLTSLFNLLDRVWHNEEHPEKSIALTRDKLIERLDDKASIKAVEAWLARFNDLTPDSEKPPFHWDGEQLILPGNHKNLKGHARNVKNWLKGDWLEHLVYHWVQAAGVPESGVALNLKGGEDESNSNSKREADLLVQHDSRTHIVEVKAAIPANKSAVEIQTQLTSLQNHFGRVSLILFAGPQLVSQLDNQQRQHLEDRLQAGNAKLCTSQEELLEALGLNKMTSPQAKNITNKTNEDAPSQEPPKGHTPTNPQSETNNVSKPPAKPSKSTAEEEKIVRQKIHQLCHLAFLRAVWGEDQTDNAADIARARQELLQLDIQEAITRFERELRLGRHAHKLGKTLRNKLDETGPDSEALTTWLNNIKNNNRQQVYKHLTITLDKWKEDQENRKRRTREYQQKRKQQPHAVNTSSLAPVVLKPGEEHPNNLRSLSPSSQWEILIDETGRHFDSDADLDAQEESGVGRMVAVIKPRKASLPPIRSNFHANKAEHAEIDGVLHNLLSTPQVGVFGFTMRDRLASGSYWMNHVIQLVRWVLYMLPAEEGKPLNINASIELRSSYTPQNGKLTSLSEMLEGEFKTRYPERFGQLSLNMQIVGKTHPDLAYADAIAFTWGSPKKISNDRLKKSRLLGNCLLDSNTKQALPYLYQSLSHNDHLPASEWFDLCTGAHQEGDNGLLTGWLERYGSNVKQDSSQWQYLLEEVKRRQQMKRISVFQLASTLSWLKRHQPSSSSLSGELELEFISTQLALTNHQGRVDYKSAQALLELGKTLEEENAQAVCHAYLRAAVATTNRFEFGVMKSHLEEWTEKPVAIPGRLNHAKLLSTLGQLEAFERNHTLAKDYFAKSLAVIDKLSDEMLAKRERLQTSTYLAMVELDDGSHSPQAARDRVGKVIMEKTGKPLTPAAQQFAHGGSGDATYVHHLLLRACIAHPEMFAEETRDYLSQAHQWQWHDGHPWQLIHAYRGWLLMQQTSPDIETASIHFSAALDICWHESSGVTLQWIGAVLHALASNLIQGFDADIPMQATPQALKENLPQAPHRALEKLQALPANVGHKQRWGCFSECLPFNFH